MPLFGTFLKLSTNGPSSCIPVSGMVHTGGESLSMGLGISRVDSDVDQMPFTRFSTACGTAFDPRVDGSSVAQRGKDARRAVVASILFVGMAMVGPAIL